MTSALLEAPVKVRKTSLKFAPAEAVVKLQRTFRRVARKLVRRDVHLRRDVLQEMSLTTLESGGEHTVAWFQRRAYWQAYNYVRQVIDRPERLVANVRRFSDKRISDRQHDREQTLALAEG
jgi:hypothetical protein